MNSKLILSLLNHKKSEQGFTNAFAQKETASSVGIAETGITRSLAKLNTPTYYFYLTMRLYVKKNITMSGSANLEHIDTGKPERFALFGIGNSTQIFTINGAASSTGMFIYAPNASLTFNGAAGVNPDLTGAVWVKDFKNNGNNLEMQVPDNFGSVLANIYRTFEL